MEFKVKREEFLECISKTQGIIEKRSNMPILSSILISAEQEKITVSATDLEISFQQSVPADVIEEGNVVVPGRKLFEIIRESKREEFYVKDEENQRVFISDGIAHFRLSSLPPEDFPVLTEPSEVDLFPVEGPTIRDMIKKTAYAISTEDVGFKLSGMFVEKKEKEEGTYLRFVATDGHRLSLIEKNIPEIEDLELSEGILIPKKGITELNKMSAEPGKINIGIKDQNFVVKKGNRTLVIRLLDAKFPNYESVIPEKSDHTIFISRTRFIEALRRMLIVGTDKYRAVRIILQKEKIGLISTNPELGEAFEEIDIIYEGKGLKEKMEIAFNPKFFLDALQPMESGTVSLGFIDNNNPCIIKGEEDHGFLALIMPMRL